MSIKNFRLLFSYDRKYHGRVDQEAKKYIREKNGSYVWIPFPFLLITYVKVAKVPVLLLCIT